LQLSKKSYLCRDMIAHENLQAALVGAGRQVASGTCNCQKSRNFAIDMIARLEKAAATLAGIWGVTPQEVAERFRIALDLSHLQAIELGRRAKEAMLSNDKKYQREITFEKKNNRKVSEQTVQLLEDVKVFKKLRKELMLFVKSRLNASRFEIEDIVSDTLESLCYYKASSAEDLIRMGMVIARRRIANFLRRKCSSPLEVRPHEDFFIQEEVFAANSDSYEAVEADLPLTTDPETAFRRLAAELVRLLGMKHAAVAVGMREKTFAPMFAC